MKTAEERAADLVSDFMDYTGDNLTDDQLDYFALEIKKELKIQDKITRLACVDAIALCPEDMSNSDLKSCIRYECLRVKAV
jgi:hypothetical protein